VACPWAAAAAQIAANKLIKIGESRAPPVPSGGHFVVGKFG
jgi:hypothetical protein